MPHKRKDSPYWWISFTNASGQRIRESSGSEDYKEAAALEGRRRHEAHQQATWGTEPSRTFDDLMLSYLRETSQKRSHERDKYSAKRLYAHFSGKVLNGMKPQDVNDYKRARVEDGVKDGTIIKELRLFSAAINYARKEWGWDIPNVVAGRAPKKPASRLRWLTQKEYQALVAAARACAKRTGKAGYLADFITLAVNSGMRRGELLGLEWDRVDLGHRLVYLQPDHNKPGVFQTVPLNDKAVEALRSRFGQHERWVFCNGDQPLGSVKKPFALACEKAKLEGVTVHTLRHTFAAWLVQAGVPIRTVSELLRHSDIRTSMIYSHLSPDNARSGVAILDDLQRDQIVTTSSEKAQKTAKSGKAVTLKAI